MLITAASYLNQHKSLLFMIPSIHRIGKLIYMHFDCPRDDARSDVGEQQQRELEMCRLHALIRFLLVPFHCY